MITEKVLASQGRGSSLCGMPQSISVSVDRQINMTDLSAREPQAFGDPAEENNEPYRVSLGEKDKGLPRGQGLRPPLNGAPAQRGDDRVHLPLFWEDKEDGLIARVLQLDQLTGEH